MGPGADKLRFRWISIAAILVSSSSTEDLELEGLDIEDSLHADTRVLCRGRFETLETSYRGSCIRGC